YQIASYCDELVPDGRGGTEPRFTCNVYLQQRGDATRVLQDLCSVFRGMVYWAAGTAVPVADMPRDPVYTYTQANVIDGRFVYSGSRRKDRSTVALVSYNDMGDMARQKLVYVQDDEGVARYGVRQTEISAFGCTSESQAYRMGQWALLTAKRETQSVSFSVGLDGTLCAPGQIIRIADNMRAGRRIGGRIRTATRSTIEIDAELGIQYGDELTVILPSGVAETRKVSKAYGVLLTADLTTYTVDSTELTADMISLPGTTMTVVVETQFSAAPRAQSVWALEAPTLKTQLYTVMSVTEG
uniref:phage tail protein n=1 Tax=Comamonas testosteroni TaxID=285 RepID=UPI000A88C43A